MVTGNDAGWASAQTVGLLAGAAVLFAAFVACIFQPIEARVAHRRVRVCMGALSVRRQRRFLEKKR